MKIPHVIDYYSGDDSIVSMSTIPCIVEQEEYISTYEQMLIIRRIHHFGYKIWLGKRERIKSFIYEKIDGENGPINILSHEGQFIVPRKDVELKTTRITLCKKSIYKIRPRENLKEIVLHDNKPKIIDYKLEKYTSKSDEGKGIKGYIGFRKKEVIILN